MATTQALVSRTETEITIHWELTSGTAQQLSYSLDNGSTWSAYEAVTGTSGDYTVTGLTANTTYQVKTSIQTGGSWVTSSALSVTTYNYPFATIMPAITIGQSVNIGLYNPLGRSVTVEMLAEGGTVADTTTAGGQTARLEGDPAILYASIPNAKYGRYRVAVTYSGHTETRNGGAYNVDQAASVPVIGSLTYADNSAAAAITGDSSQIVQNISTPLFTATGLAAVNGASLAACEISVNGATYSATPAATTNIQGGTINAAANIIATLTLTDSRGLTATATVEVQMVPWSNPTGIISVARQQNFYTATDVKVDADFTQIGSSAVTITLTGDAVPIPGKTTPAQVTATIPDNVTTVVNFDNEFEWNITITLVDSFGGTTTYTGIHLGRGIPINFTDRILRSYAVNGFPTHENSIEVFEGSFYKDNVDIASGTAGLSVLNERYTGSLTSLTTITKTVTVTGDGFITISASMTSSGGTYGLHRAEITKGNNLMAYSAEYFNQAQSGRYGTSATANLQVSNGDTLTITLLSSRYMTGNTYEAVITALAFGCTLAIS